MHARPFKEKRLILSKGQVFGEEECIRAVLSNGHPENYPKPMASYYTVTAASNDCEVLWAYVDDIYKMLKNERKVVAYFNNQYIRKYPSHRMPDAFLESAFQENRKKEQGDGTAQDNKMIELSKPLEKSIT